MSFRRLLALIIASIMLIGLCVPVSCYAAQAEVIRVGYLEQEGFFSSVQGGATGVGKELMNHLSSYTGYTFEYTPYTLTEGLELLDSGGIDLFVPLQKSATREEQFIFCTTPISSTKAVLVVQPDTDIWFEDYEHMHGLSVGAVAGSHNIQRLRELLAQHDCTIVINDAYNTIAELQTALDSGQEDAILLDADRTLRSCRIIAALDSENVYFAAKSTNTELMQELNQAFRQIELNSPFLRSELEEKYHVVDGLYPALTRSEAEYVSTCPQVTVGLGAFEYEQLSKVQQQAAIMLLDSLHNLTGLDFVAMPAASVSQAYEQFKNGAYQMLLPMDNDLLWAKQHNAYLTNRYFTYEYQRIHKRNTTKLTSVAVLRDSYIAYYFRDQPVEVILCDSLQQALDLVKDDQVDAAYCPTFIGDYYATVAKFKDLIYTTDYSVPTSSYCIAISRSSDPQLTSILDKALRCIPRDEAEEIFSMQTVVHTPTTGDLFYLYPFLSASVMLCMLALLIVLLVLFVSSRHSRAQNKLLQAALSAKHDFLSRMSHNMRTPMNAVIGLTALAMDEKDNTPTTKKLLQQISSSGEFLLGLINDVLDMSVIESSDFKLHNAPYTYDEFINSLQALITPLAKEKNIRFSFTSEKAHPPIFVDKVRYNQIFFNLLSNAFKYTPQGGRVDFTMEYKPLPNSRLQFDYYVKDSGIGMSSEFQARLFESFSQESAAYTSELQGLGLGLSIAKSITDLMGGRINVQSEKGMGSTFHVQLNLLATNTGASPAQLDKEPINILHGKRVLLVEDNALNAMVASKLLEKVGIEVLHAENGSIGLDTFAGSPIGYFDAILMDIRMPVMDGLAAAREIRAMARADARIVPILAMTANAFDTDVKQTLEAGMNSHLAKPVDTTQLYSALAKAIQDKPTIMRIG